MSIKMQKVGRDGKDQAISCTEQTYHEIVKVVKGKCACERMSTMTALRGRGYRVIQDTPKAAPQKKEPAKKAAKKPAAK